RARGEAGQQGGLELRPQQEGAAEADVVVVEAEAAAQVPDMEEVGAPGDHLVIDDLGVEGEPTREDHHPALEVTLPLEHQVNPRLAVDLGAKTSEGRALVVVIRGEADVQRRLGPGGRAGEDENGEQRENLT